MTLAEAAVWALSVRDGWAHALADPPAGPPWGVLTTRCGARHPMACRVRVVRDITEVCPECVAGATARPVVAR